ncbi:transcription termination/antitermination NusG family protein [Brucella rhizosphaerae]|uniref:transcription termination/antitermination NusG family protein n=1 Tax=Brucella rhizosphaerae TaxID=571254 RepID=UPI0009FF9180|nr:transcription termination/antitermination NusG family protein [Brucella rhizosphaerae]
MMAIDQRHIDIAIASAPSEAHCRAIDKVLAERRRIARLRSVAANRVGDGSPWLVLQVVSGREFLVRDALSGENIEVLVPMKMGPKIRRQHREIPAKMQPVMNGYVLARCAISNECIAGLLSFEGVVSVLGGYEAPYLVSAEKAILFKVKAEGGKYDHEHFHRKFIGVKWVRIADGPFAGSRAELVSGGAKGNGLVVVEVAVMGRPVAMTLPIAILEPL